MFSFLGRASARTPACLGWQGWLWQMAFTDFSTQEGTVRLGERSPTGAHVIVQAHPTGAGGLWQNLFI